MRRRNLDPWRKLVLMVVLPTVTALADERPLPKSDVDATTIRRKVFCGYQGWFRCPGDPAGEGWRHWSRESRTIGPNALTFEMWPDMTEYQDDEKFSAPGFTYADGKPAS